MKNVSRVFAIMAVAVVLLSVAATPGYCARLNPQPLPPRWSSAVVHNPVSDFLAGFNRFMSNIIIIGGRH